MKRSLPAASAVLAALLLLAAPARAQPYGAPARREPREARQGLLFALGIGGAGNYLSGVGHGNGLDLRVSIGYGFSDRFQLFFALDALPANYGYGYDATSWTGTVRGQTVLFGDRRGNGLNLNFGAGLGGMDITGPYAFVSQRVGLAVAGGLSLDLRVEPWFAISPELTLQWHQIPNDPGFANDEHRSLGLLINFVWYSPY